jgi:hypothetical protein
MKASEIVNLHKKYKRIGRAKSVDYIYVPVDFFLIAKRREEAEEAVV